jgi:hypothetical protein
MRCVLGCFLVYSNYNSLLIMSNNNNNSNHNPLNVYFQGSLRKKGGTMGGWSTWKTRWFVLHDNGLSYYDSESAYTTGKKELGYLQLDHNFSIVPATVADHNNATECDCYFKINSTGRSLLVRSKTSSECNYWCNLLTKIKKENQTAFQALLKPYNANNNNNESVPSVNINNTPLANARGTGLKNLFSAASAALKGTPKSLEEVPSGVKINSKSIKEGYLSKLGNGVKSWKRRFFILVPGTLDYYKSAYDKKSAGSIPIIQDSTIISLIKLQFTFAIVPAPGHRKYIITAASEAEMQSWLDILQSLIKNKIVKPKNYNPATNVPTNAVQSHNSNNLSPNMLNSNGVSSTPAYDSALFGSSTTVVTSSIAPSSVAVDSSVNNFSNSYLPYDLPANNNRESFTVNHAAASPAVNEEHDLVLLQILGGSKAMLSNANNNSLPNAHPQQSNNSFTIPNSVSLSNSISMSNNGYGGPAIPPKPPAKPLPSIPPQPTQSNVASTNSSSSSSSSLPSSDPRLADFISFSGSIYSEENVQFYLDVENFNRQSDNPMMAQPLALGIYDKYIRSGAEFEIFLPPHIKLVLDQRLSNSSKLYISPAMFEVAQKQIFSIIRADILPQFLADQKENAGRSNTTASNTFASSAAPVIGLNTAGSLESTTVSASIDELFHELLLIDTKSGAVDNKYRGAFLLNYHVFMTNEQLLNRLITAYYDTKPNVSTVVSTAWQQSEAELLRLQLANKLNILTIFQYWLKNYTSDFEPLQVILLNFFAEALKETDQYINSSNPNKYNNMAESNEVSNNTSYSLSTLNRVGLDGFKRLIAEINATIAIAQAQFNSANSSAEPLITSSDQNNMNVLMNSSADLSSLDGNSYEDSDSDSEGAILAEECAEYDEISVTQQYGQSMTQSVKESQSAASRLNSLNPANSIANKSTSYDRIDICDYSVHRISECMSLIDHQMFRSIKMREFCNKEWTRAESAPHKAANILFMVDQFNRRSYWVASEILSREDFNLRLKCLKHFIDLASQCLSLHNFYAVFSIVNGLSLTPVHRLKALWNKLSSGTKDKFEFLKTTATDTGRNYRFYRKQFKIGLGKPQVPHLAVVLKDCFQLEEIKTTDSNTGKINFHKFLKQYKELFDVQQALSHDYYFTAISSATSGNVTEQLANNLHYNPTSSMNLLNPNNPNYSSHAELIRLISIAYTNVLEEDKLWQRSYRFQPKPTEASNNAA